MNFSKDFVWGAASAAYQIEGAWQADGKGESIWDAFSHRRGNIKGNHTGDVACDSYHRVEEDVQLLKALGVRAYRFSVSWPRILPAGTGWVNLKGLAYYDKLVDLLLQNGIAPYLTLYHWDLPLALEEQGGWQSRKTAEAFGEFAAVVARHFAGRVGHYITLNEPQCFVGLGYGTGQHAPGLRLEQEPLLWAMHNALLAHGLATQAIRENSGQQVKIGLASTGQLCYPKENTAKNRQAAELASFRLADDDWTFRHNWVLDAALQGHYPTEATESMRRFARTVPDSDWAIIHQPTDFLGLNIYNGHEVAEDGTQVKRVEGFPRTALKWPVTPKVMHYGCLWLYQRYRLPLLITENGLSCNDKVYVDGLVHDPDRIDFLHRYLASMHKAMEEGVPILGYFHWSLCDNFEWHNGYDERFGLVFVDYSTQTRICKDSAAWYTKVIAGNGACLTAPAHSPQ